MVTALRPDVRDVHAIPTVVSVTSNDRSLPWIGGNAKPVDGLMTAAEAIEAAGLGGETEKVALQTVTGTPVPGKFANVRVRDGHPFGVVGKSYVDIVDEDAFAFIDNLVADYGNKYSVVGSIDDGRQTYIVVELSAVEPITINGDSSMFETYAIFRNSHDGSCALSGIVTPVRVKCWNAIPLAVRSATGRFAVRHSGNVESKMKMARQTLGISIDYMRRFELVAERLLDVTVTDSHAEAVIRDAFRMPETVEQKGDDSERFVNHAATRVLDRYTDAVDIADFRGTAWGVVNAVAEFVDHEKQYGRGNADAFDSKTTSVLWGQSASIVNRTVALISPQTASLMDAKTERAAARIRHRVAVG